MRGSKMSGKKTLADFPVWGSVLLLFFFLCATQGCINRVTESGPSPSVADPVGATLIGQESHWSPADGCSWSVTYQVFNTGNETSRGCFLQVSLVGARNHQIRDQRTVYVSPLTSQEVVSYEILLDGECIHEYSVEARVLPV